MLPQLCQILKLTRPPVLRLENSLSERALQYPLSNLVVGLPCPADLELFKNK
jgi:hypothetical protein